MFDSLNLCFTDPVVTWLPRTCYMSIFQVTLLNKWLCKENSFIIWCSILLEIQQAMINIFSLEKLKVIVLFLSINLVLQTNKGMLNLCTAAHRLKLKLARFLTCSCPKTTVLSSTEEISCIKVVSMLEAFKQLPGSYKVTQFSSRHWEKSLHS